MLNQFVEMGEAEYGGDAVELSTLWAPLFFYEGNELCSEAQSYYLPVAGGLGYGNLAETIASNVEADIRLNSLVTEINYEDENVVISYNANGLPRQVNARTALVTVSLGVLKAGAISFTPNLPDNKQDVIDNMGFGLLNKMTMYWNDEEDVVWPNDSYWFNLVTEDDSTTGVWTSFFNPTKEKGVPCLIAWIAGDEAWAAEDNTDEEILEQVMVNLKSMFPTLRQPDEYFITRWGQEEHFRGSYSFSKAGRDHLEDAANLGERVGNVWFAGEATDLAEWHATTSAAWDSGEIAAGEMASVL